MVIFSLDDEFTPDELEAGRREEREGVWWHTSKPYENASIEGDGRPLSQDDTDRLIEHELMMSCSDTRELERILPARYRRIHMPMLNKYGTPEPHDEEYLWAVQQRGGIHSDPLIRSIARRAFGERDVGWFDQPICACGHEREFHGPRSSQVPVAILRGQVVADVSRSRDIPLDGDASPVTGIYVGHLLTIDASSRRIRAYDGTRRVATVDSPFGESTPAGAPYYVASVREPHRCLCCGTCTFSRERVDELHATCTCPGSWFMDPETMTINVKRAGRDTHAHRYLNGASRAIERARRTIAGGPVRHDSRCAMLRATDMSVASG